MRIETMDKLLIQNVTILNGQKNLYPAEADVLIADGLITEVGQSIVPNSSYTVLNGEGQFLSPGFFDLNANFGEPGFETREGMESGSMAAIAGGFTGLALMPNTRPPVHSKSEVLYLINQSRGSLLDVYPLGSLSHNREGRELAELYDMKMAGAVAFTDGDRPVADAGLMSRALLYSKGFNGLIMAYAEDKDIAGKGKMNEGVMSTLLGMPGNPALAEELMIIRDLYLAEYNESPIHFSTISTAKSVDLIRQARKKGIRVTCDVAAHHLIFTDEALAGFDSNFKVKPPLRGQGDTAALLMGLNDGTIDAIVSQHTPLESECKNVEFEIADYGIIGLQTALSLALKAGLSPDVIVEKMALNPRRILEIEVPQIKAGERANLVMFNPDADWEFNLTNNYSRSVNSPLLGQKLKGKVTFVSNNCKNFLS